MHFFRRKDPPPSPLGLDELTISLENLDANDLLCDWRWLVDESYSPVLLSAIGDLFVQSQDGSIWWLCTADGHFSQVAPDLTEFRRLTMQPEQSREWFLPDLVGQLRQRGMLLEPGKCYSYKIAPFLGGKVEPKNMDLTNVYVHFSFLGGLYRACKDLPPGTKIRSIRVEKPK